MLRLSRPFGAAAPFATWCFIAACGSTSDAGLFGDSTGGASSGGTASGTGGSVDSGGASGGENSGGAATGGMAGTSQAGTGGSTGEDASIGDSGGIDSGTGGATTAPPGKERVRCGSTVCDTAAGQSCCITQPINPLDQSPEFSCVTSAQGCTHRIRCDSDSDCQDGVCCLGSTLTGQLAECRATCGGSQTPLRCRLASDCGDGQTCCGTLRGTFPVTGYIAFECADTCPENSSEACEPSTTCGGSQSCEQSSYLPPGFTVCR